MAVILFRLIAAAAVLSSTCFAFSAPRLATARHGAPCEAAHEDGRTEPSFESEPSTPNLLSRRSALSSFAWIPLGTLALSNPPPAVADAGKGKIVVFGGSGWVGAHVSADLRSRGYDVVSISRSTADEQIKRTESILGTAIEGVTYSSLNAGTAEMDDLVEAMKDGIAVISCAGLAPGSLNVKDGNALPNSRIARAAKTAGVPKFVYIGVSSSLANGPAKFLLSDYFQGKAEAERVVTKEYGPDDSLIIKPAIIAGGTPGEIRPPGPPGVKPVDVKMVARLAVAGALGNVKGKVDGNDDILAIAN